MRADRLHTLLEALLTITVMIGSSAVNGFLSHVYVLFAIYL